MKAFNIGCISSLSTSSDVAGTEVRGNTPTSVVRLLQSSAAECRGNNSSRVLGKSQSSEASEAKGNTSSTVLRQLQTSATPESSKKSMNSPSIASVVWNWGQRKNLTNSPSTLSFFGGTWRQNSRQTLISFPPDHYSGHSDLTAHNSTLNNWPTAGDQGICIQRISDSWNQSWYSLNPVVTEGN